MAVGEEGLNGVGGYGGNIDDVEDDDNAPLKCMAGVDDSGTSLSSADATVSSSNGSFVVVGGGSENGIGAIECACICCVDNAAAAVDVDAGVGEMLQRRGEEGRIGLSIVRHTRSYM